MILSATLFLLVISGFSCREPSYTIPTGNGAYGADMSGFNDYYRLNWTAFIYDPKQPLSFVFAQGTRGAKYVDSTFVSNWNNIAQRGAVPGAYHVFRSNDSVEENLENVRKNIFGKVPFDHKKHPFAVDFETNLGFSLNNTEITPKIYKFLVDFEKENGFKPIIYTNYDRWNIYVGEAGDDYDFSDYPLWISKINSKDPYPLPKPWRDYTIWQYTNGGIHSGSLMDLNWWPNWPKYPENLSKNGVYGADISHYNHENNRTKFRFNFYDFIHSTSVCKQPLHFVFTKGTEGSNYVDRTFLYNWNNITQQGAVPGVYHFYRSDATVEQNLENVRRNIFGKIQFDHKKHLFAVDIENNKGNLNKTAMARDLHKFLVEFEKERGFKPMIYTGYDFWKNHIGNAGDAYNFSQYPLWIARYVSTVPPSADTPNLLPKPWKNYTIWQYTENGVRPGIQPDKTVDLNWWPNPPRHVRNAQIGHIHH